MPSFESDSDRLALLTELGEDATYTPLLGAAKSIKVLFENVEKPQVVQGAEVVGAVPTAEARTSDLTGTVLGGELLIDGTTYTIKAVFDDDTGMTDLDMETA